MYKKGRVEVRQKDGLDANRTARKHGRHSWRLALFVAITAMQIPEIDYEKLLFMSLIHELGELYRGDQSAALLSDKGEKTKEEKFSIERIWKPNCDLQAGDFEKSCSTCRSFVCYVRNSVYGNMYSKEDSEIHLLKSSMTAINRSTLIKTVIKGVRY